MTVQPLATSTAPAPRRAPAPSRAPLRLVTPRPVVAPKTPFVLLLFGLLGAGLVGLLLLNTIVAEDAFRLHDLQRSGVELADREQEAMRALEQLENPMELARRAESLGMVSSGQPVFLRLPDGAVLGQVPETAPVP